MNEIDKFITGDGEKFNTLDAANAHVSEVFDSTGVILEIRELARYEILPPFVGETEPLIGMVEDRDMTGKATSHSIIAKATNEFRAKEIVDALNK